MTPDVARTDVPPLVDGERLTRDEFERRYEAMPHISKAELIEGVVYMPSPVRLDSHGWPHAALVTCVGIYAFLTPGTKTADNTTTRLDVINEPQPDVMLFILPECGGQVRLSKDDYVEQAPELIAEVAGSSKAIDLGPKFTVYQRSGVREYIVWRAEDAVIEWFVLRDEKFQPLEPEGGLLKSSTFPGLWLDVAAMLRNDTRRMFDVANQGASSPEHAAFVEKLKHARGGI